eukprot:GHVU01161907.1.p1 GENE.GHVU01161907.1~~GHVU01161907.1.p1  ORF type:complete len:184 (+),score=33.31 GHVU01161907.1:97-648(+)
MSGNAKLPSGAVKKKAKLSEVVKKEEEHEFYFKEVVYDPRWSFHHLYADRKERVWRDTIVVVKGLEVFLGSKEEVLNNEEEETPQSSQTDDSTNSSSMTAPLQPPPSVPPPPQQAKFNKLQVTLIDDLIPQETLSGEGEVTPSTELPGLYVRDGSGRAATFFGDKGELERLKLFLKPEGSKPR